MNLPKALLISAAVTLGLTLLLRSVAGISAFGLFLFLPLGWLVTRAAKRRGSSDKTPSDRTPIEPR